MTAEVLVVDDDQDIRELIAVFLQEAGYTVYEAPNGKRALDRLRTHPARLVVLLDLLMPEMGGFELLQAAAEEPPLLTKHAYIIVAATRRTPPPELVPILAQLQIPILLKPFDIEELLSAVHKAASTLQ